MKNKIVSVVFAVALAVLILTFSIGLPIYVRPFYYVQIDLLDMVEYTGYSYEVIKEAYDEVLNYLTLPWCEFGTGELRHSESGASHFADCLVLFNLNASALLISLAVVVVVLVLRARGKVELLRPQGLHIGFWSGASLLTTFGVIAALAASDFDRAFVVFHSLFFPGKTNWYFDPYTDEIINVMPAEFFMACAILIVSSILLISLGLIIHAIVSRKRAK
jgi:integral membrane protein (TIGR01906 family)